MVISIPLSKTGKHTGKYVAIVSKEDKDLGDIEWWINHKYAGRSIGGWKKQSVILMHRVIMERVLERPLEKSEFVDHANGNPLDNRRENLRLATPSQNAANKRLSKRNTSGYKGVSWSKPKEKWQALISCQNKLRHLGYFNDPEEAHAAYCEKAKELFGEFANFGNGGES